LHASEVELNNSLHFADILFYTCNKYSFKGYTCQENGSALIKKIGQVLYASGFRIQPRCKALTGLNVNWTRINTEKADLKTVNQWPAAKTSTSLSALRSLLCLFSEADTICSIRVHPRSSVSHKKEIVHGFSREKRI
jgi:hypothetical protein